LHKAPVPQLFLAITHRSIVAAATPSGSINVFSKRVVRTLSRDFWQQKNFHAHRLRVSSPLAKTGFPRESLQMIRGWDFRRARIYLR
jgi:hypothetical protein